MVNQIIEDATRALEVVVDESWIPWAGCLIPNMICRVRAEAEARAREEHDQKLREEVQQFIDEKLARAAKRDRQLEEKLMVVLEGQLTQAELEVNSKAEEMGEGEESEAIRTEEVGTMGGTQSSAMEVDKEVEDEVVVVEEAKQGEMRKWAPLSPPKTLRKRVCAGMATRTPVGSQVKGSLVQGGQVVMGTAGSMGEPCWRCIKH